MVVLSVKPLFITILVVSLTFLVVFTLPSPRYPFSQYRISGEPSLGDSETHGMLTLQSNCSTIRKLWIYQSGLLRWPQPNMKRCGWLKMTLEFQLQDPMLMFDTLLLVS